MRKKKKKKIKIKYVLDCSVKKKSKKILFNWVESIKKKNMCKIT